MKSKITAAQLAQAQKLARRAGSAKAALAQYRGRADADATVTDLLDRMAHSAERTPVAQLGVARAELATAQRAARVAAKQPAAPPAPPAPSKPVFILARQPEFQSARILAAVRAVRAGVDPATIADPKTARLARTMASVRVGPKRKPAAAVEEQE